ncbi:BZ3500_MvSof-1268-A1-R1_Chr8-2g10301 [Microbotryum saponariae]|uniref:BZ3500_MvSof-1268-A1-R1_Chr8-2g10301 protein n=1 Tax=Microbotryum saponariae TaxID=289078 RepID=A0A2X0N4T0_9BASI|nr:BZ3500_MvSof-1268-A1-R1_Chr8-2g10301 [Microbotryum saponariae]SDA02132.1 BZ3501_MvSof-1269-A2-R1_Chr8-2g10050 [Microbotryum saponariae]
MLSDLDESTKFSPRTPADSLVHCNDSRRQALTSELLALSSLEAFSHPFSSFKKIYAFKADRLDFTFARANAPFPLATHSHHSHHLTRLGLGTDRTTLHLDVTCFHIAHMRHAISKMHLDLSQLQLDVSPQPD